jgi:hypothetical protein
LRSRLRFLRSEIFDFFERRMTAWSVRASRLIVGITGASGAAYGVAALKALRAAGVETHLVISKR